ncbi:hypothetical protein HPB52_010719 [Rhipicephalus sanguineus]|uniref:Uncharacterized protein n=1 Tax=Rhipicephalus sanguineus TaxID=34632 RepID=A0A9D4Q1U2_RHISA|nr:hypothetical protein HPB52_010719 [Rhipicephalus sanguineus]
MSTSGFLPNHGLPSAMMAKYQEMREKPGWHLEFPAYVNDSPGGKEQNGWMFAVFPATIAEESPPSSATPVELARASSLVHRRTGVRRASRTPLCSGTLSPAPTRRGCGMNKRSDSARSSVSNLQRLTYRRLLPTPMQSQGAWRPREPPAQPSAPLSLRIVRPHFKQPFPA